MSIIFLAYTLKKILEVSKDIQHNYVDVFCDKITLFKPEEIQAKVLEKLRIVACKYIPDAKYCVITVPAYFNEKQKDATRNAC